MLLRSRAYWRRRGKKPTLQLIWPWSKPIGILLCAETDQTIAKYSVLSQSEQLFATKYMSYLPSEAELIAEIERGKKSLSHDLHD